MNNTIGIKIIKTTGFYTCTSLVNFNFLIDAMIAVDTFIHSRRAFDTAQVMAAW